MSDPAPSTQWSLPARYLVAVLLLLLAAVAMLLLLPLLQVLFLAFLISFLIFIPARALNRRTRAPYSLIIAVFFLAMFGLLACALLTLIPALIDAFNSLWTSVQSRYDQLAAQLSAASPADGVVSIAGIPVDLSAIPPLSDIAAALGQLAGGILGLAGSIFNSVAGLVALAFSALIIALFLLIDLPVSSGMLTDWIPPQYSREISLLFARLDQIWLRFFKAEVVIGLIIGLGNFVIFLLLGVPHALPLAIIMGTIGLIPTIGGILAAIPIMIVCLLSGSTRLTSLDPLTFTLLVVIVSVTYNQLIYTFVSPRISGAAVHLPAVAVVVGVLAALALVGILGALLVVPIIGSVRLFVHFALFKLALRDPYPDDAEPRQRFPVSSARCCMSNPRPGAVAPERGILDSEFGSGNAECGASQVNLEFIIATGALRLQITEDLWVDAHRWTLIRCAVRPSIESASADLLIDQVSAASHTDLAGFCR